MGELLRTFGFAAPAIALMLVVGCGGGSGNRATNPGEACGSETCGEGEFCCNRSCSICAPTGGVCTQQFCG